MISIWRVAKVKKIKVLENHQFYNHVTKPLENTYGKLKNPLESLDDHIPKKEKFRSLAHDVKPLQSNFGKSNKYQESDEDYALVVEEITEPLSRSLVMNTEVEDHIKEKINSMMERLENRLWSCTQCGKTSKERRDLGRHVETHIEGVTYPCPSCGKPYRSKRALDSHFSQQHE